MSTCGDFRTSWELVISLDDKFRESPVLWTRNVRLVLVPVRTVSYLCRLGFPVLIMMQIIFLNAVII